MEKYMWAMFLIVFFILFISVVTWLSYFLGQTKTENAKVSGAIRFFLSFIPPLALIYLVILSLKDEVSTV